MSEHTIVIDGHAAQDREVAGFVARVRAALDDLPLDDVDELTLGMEADLGEIRAEAGDLASRLGTPETYAAELRAAAGLPPRTVTTSRPRGVREVVAARRAAVAGSLDRAQETRPWLRTAVSYVATLRPAWWLLRAFLAAWVASTVLGTGVVLGVLLFLLAVPASVWLGLHRRDHSPGVRATLTALNTVGALIALGFAVQLAGSFLGHDGAPDYYAEPVPASPSGLDLDGTDVQNLFVYDAAGKPVQRARVLTDTGAPVVIAPADGGDPILGVDAYGTAYRNTFPVAHRGEDPWHPVRTQEEVDAGMERWLPTATLPPLVPLTQPSASAPATATTAPTAATTPAPAPTTTPAPSTPAASSTPAAKPSASATRSATASATRSAPAVAPSATAAG